METVVKFEEQLKEHKLELTDRQKEQLCMEFICSLLF